MEKFTQLTKTFSDLAWGPPLLVLLIGGGVFLTLYSRFLPFMYLPHAIRLLKNDKASGSGEISHMQALSSAIAATVGMGNISGVAIAISMGGPGALFWMWVSAILGMATKFFTCSLAVMYREKGKDGTLRGGPMYYLVNGLGHKWKPAAVLFCVCCLVGSLPIFQANQLTQLIGDVFLVTDQMSEANLMQFRGMIGFALSVLVGTVIFGGLKRIALVAERIVPAMVGFYVLLVFIMMVLHYDKLIPSLALVFHDAFSGNALLGGAVGALIVVGVRRAAFSNEAGIGTAPLFHGDSKTDNPIKEGLVAMIGPFVDTIIVCTMTALAILVTDAWTLTGIEGISITLQAFVSSYGESGKALLFICTFAFSITTLFTAFHFGAKAFYFLTKGRYMTAHLVAYVLAIIVGAVISVDLVVNIIDGMYALMAFPTMIGAILLAPKIMAAAKAYFNQTEGIK